MSNGVEFRGAWKEISIIPARETGDDFMKKVMPGVVLEVWVGSPGGTRRKGTGMERQCKQRCGAESSELVQETC